MGESGTAIATILDGQAKLPASLLLTPVPPTKFVEASGKAFNTIPASNSLFFRTGQRPGAGKTGHGAGP